MSAKDNDDDDETGFDAPEMAPSRAAIAEQTSRARARLITAAKGRSLWDVVDDYTLDALVELRMALDSPSPKLRFHAARDITAVWTRMPPRPALPPDRTATPEEREARLLAAEKDEGVRAWLKSRGWKEPPPVKESN